MVSKLLFLTSLALAQWGTAAPAPAPEAEIVHSDFSFSKWVDTLISDPEHALTPEQALAAANATRHTRFTDKRQRVTDCIQHTTFPAGVSLVLTESARY